MSNRQKWLEELYFYDGRDKRDHEMHGLFMVLLRNISNSRVMLDV